MKVYRTDRPKSEQLINSEIIQHSLATVFFPSNISEREQLYQIL
jgi:hypothetical protein